MRRRPELDGIPETMLWTLHSRASEAKRPGGLLDDPAAVRIYDSLDYDYAKHFGPPNVLFAVRAALIDRELTRWLEARPDGLVVSLGEGLETQALRVDNGRMRWLSVDLPEAIRVREMFLRPTERFRHLAADATDGGWLEAAAAAGARDVFIIAQGLFMYLEPAGVKRLIVTIAERLPGAHVVFDVVSREISDLAREGHWQTTDYRLPPMPWGLDRREIAPTLRRWLRRRSEVHHLPYRHPSRRPVFLDRALAALRLMHPPTQSLVHVVV
jgi:O-methyltransferase involved in polyketide biosynthesis